MVECQIVHKVLYSQAPKRTIAMVKFVDPNNPKETRFFISSFDVGIEDVSLSDLQGLLTYGIEVPKDSLEIFLNKDDYDEHELLTDNEGGVVVSLKE